MSRVLVLVLGCGCLAAGVLPSVAAAHAYFVRSQPGPGEVLARGPASVRVFFDGAAEALPGIQVVRNGGGSVLAGRPHTAPGSSRVLVLPLRRGLPAADYTVRWRVRSDDGHVNSGVLAFSVGFGRSPPTPALSEGRDGTPLRDVLRRFVFFTGVFLAAGAVAFQFLVARTRSRLDVLVPLAGFALALMGTRPDFSPTSRYERIDTVSAAAALCGLVAAAASWRVPRLGPVQVPAALALLVAPTLRGHALDPGQSRLLAVVADLLHVAAAAFWIGGLVQLALLFLLERPARAVLHRFFKGAVLAIAVLGLTGVLRALGELSAGEQLWRTGYGQALLVKTALLAGVFALALRNPVRRRRTSIGAELLLAAALVTAVALLTGLRPGRQVARAAARAESAARSPLRQPPRGAVVLAKQAGDLALALSVRPAGRDRAELIASVLGPDQLGIDGLAVSFRAEGSLTAAHPCGGGCYSAVLRVRPRRVTVRIGARKIRFDLPAALPAPPAAGLVRRAELVYRSLRTVVLHEQLASGRANSISTVYAFAAPNRMTYRIRGGPAGIVIGAMRWDRATPTGRWVVSPQDPLPQPEPFWTSVSNAYLLRATPATLVVSFLDRRIPAWFTLTIDRRSYRPRRLQMTAAAHFMRHRYGPFNAPVSIRPPR